MVILSTVFFASGILFSSILRAASVRYAFSEPNEVLAFSSTDVEIDYNLPYPGGVLPDSPLWFLKALRDKVWLLTASAGKRPEINLLLADKRVVGSKTLFEREKPELGFSSLTKAEKYLEEAGRLEAENRARGEASKEFSLRLAKAALKHRQITEEILKIAPEDAKPKIITSQSYSQNVYNIARDSLLSQGLTPPKNPFDGE